MNPNRATKHSAKFALVVTLLMAISALTISTGAQPAWVGRFALPYEVHWNRAVLPAGEYTITVDSKSKPALIQSADGKRSIYTNVPIVAASEAGRASVLVTIAGSERTVRSMNSPALGVSFIFNPISKTERELLAKNGQLESLPILVTKK